MKFISFIMAAWAVILYLLLGFWDKFNDRPVEWGVNGVAVAVGFVAVGVVWKLTGNINDGGMT